MCSAGPVTYHETSAQPQTPYPSQTYGLISGWSCAEPGVGPDDPFSSESSTILLPQPPRFRHQVITSLLFLGSGVGARLELAQLWCTGCPMPGEVQLWLDGTHR